MERKKKTTKNWLILWLAPTNAKGMHEAKIIHVKKHIPQDMIFICNF